MLQICCEKTVFFPYNKKIFPTMFSLINDKKYTSRPGFRFTRFGVKNKREDRDYAYKRFLISNKTPNNLISLPLGPFLSCVDNLLTVSNR